MAKKEGFFGTDNLHRNVWTIIIGIASFLCLTAYHKAFGPQRVIVESPQASQSERQVTTEASPRNKDIADLADAIRQLSKASGQNADQERLRLLAGEVDRLRNEVAQSKRQVPATTSPRAAPQLVTPVQTAPGEISVSGTAAARFDLPSSVGGYTQEQIFGVSAPTCPPKVLAAGSAVITGFTLDDPTLLARASPLRVTLDKVRSPTDLLQLQEVWVDLRAGTNGITLRTPKEPGQYQFTYGFYLRDKLSGSFPPFYSRQCTFDVSAS